MARELVISSALLILIAAPVLAQFLGNTKITIIRIEKCGQDAPNNVVNVTIHKLNRTHQGIDFYVKSPYDFDQQMAINVSAAKWGDGGWKPHAFDLYEKDACECIMRYGKKDITEILRRSGRPERCPFKIGEIRIKDYVFGGKVDAPTLFGDFRVDVQLERNNKVLTCVRAFIKSEPLAG